MWVVENVSRQIVFSGADVWQIARSVFADRFPNFTIHVGRREEVGRFAGGGLGRELMLVVADEDGYELDYGQLKIFEACSQVARELGYSIALNAMPKLRLGALDAYRGEPLPDDKDVEVCVIKAETTKRRLAIHPFVDVSADTSIADDLAVESL